MQNNRLLNSKIHALNIGVDSFYQSLIDQDTASLNLDWTPPAKGDVLMTQILSEMYSTDHNNLYDKINNANNEAIKRINSSNPVWIDIEKAGNLFEEFDKYTILHGGPPITWENMCGPMQGAVIAALKYEGLASTNDQARSLAASGRIKFRPCHDFDAVGPMTGVTSYSMPLFVVKNKTYGNYSYSTINEGAGDVIRFGAFSDNTVARLHWIEDVLAPTFKKVIKEMNGISLNPLISQALHMGDELHMRNAASTSIFLNTITKSLVDVTTDHLKLKEIINFLTQKNDQFFLNLAMCATKASAAAASGIEYSTIVTTMARNGYEIGIKVSGLGDEWFTAPASVVEGFYFPGYSEKDANLDIGDSATMEVGGVGGFAIAAAPAIVSFLGADSFQDAVDNTLDMYNITYSESDNYTIPTLDSRGTPLGIDIKKVVETGTTPLINTAIASNKAGVGMIGAGISTAPYSMFAEALKSYNKKYIEVGRTNG